MTEDINRRTGPFARNSSLESLLAEINGLLSPANQSLKHDPPKEEFSKVFLVGAHRSGSTVFLQWLASTGLVAYPTNLLSRFYGAPLVGAKIQQLLTDSRYNFRDEILDFNSEIDFSSRNGKTKGALSPNEFWYFWRRFLPFNDLDYLAEDELQARGDLKGLRIELNELAEIFEQPFALKAMIMNQNIKALDSLFQKAIFVWIRRDPVFNIQSALEARRRQYGDIRVWYSFKIKEYQDLQNLDPLQSVARQIHAINHSVETALDSLTSSRKLLVQYEDFCEDPAAYFRRLVDKLREQGGLPERDYQYNGPTYFRNTNQWHLEEYTRAKAEVAYREASTG
jgi:hypothetical protein